MRQRTPGRDQLIANVARKGDVRVAVAVQMPELPPTEAEFHAAEAVSADLDVRPGSDDGADAGARAGVSRVVAYLSSRRSFCRWRIAI